MRGEERKGSKETNEDVCEGGERCQLYRDAPA